MATTSTAKTMTPSEMLGLLIIVGVWWLLRKWRRWSLDYKKRESVSGNPGRVKAGKKYEQDRPYPECFDEMEDDDL